MSAIHSIQPKYAARRFWNAARTRMDLWLEQTKRLAREAMTDQIAIDIPLDACRLESKILYSASPANAIVDTTGLSEIFDSISNTQAASTQTDLVVIDARVAKREQLIAEIMATASPSHRIEILTLPSSNNNSPENAPQSHALDLVTQRLQQLEQVSSIQIFAHGSDGQLLLGDTLIDVSNVSSYAQAFSDWGSLVNDNADLLFFSCDLASSQRGIELLQQVHQWTQMDIAASSDRTGSAMIGGDWTLEFTLGAVETSVGLSSDFQQNWDSLLPTIQVTTADDVVDGDVSSIAALLSNRGTDNHVSLREAVLAANAQQGMDTIVLGADTYSLTRQGRNELLSLTGDLDITDDLEIIGLGRERTIIDGLHLDRLFSIRNQASVSLAELTLTRGDAGTTGNGGAIQLLDASTLSLSGVWIDHSEAIRGGAIYAEQSQLTINASQVDTNRAGWGGALFLRDSVTTISQSTLANNVATNQGGGLYHQASGQGLRLSNVTISQNVANVSGGGLYAAGNVAIQQATIAYNQASSAGGIHVASGSVTIQNSIIANSTSGDIVGSLVSLGQNLSSQPLAALSDPTDRTGNVGLLPLAATGGKTWTHALSKSSDAIDAALPEASSATDQRGMLRDRLPDIGATEYQRINGTGEVVVNGSATGNQWDTADPLVQGVPTNADRPAVAMNNDGSYVVVWSSQSLDGSGWGVAARRYDSAGNALSGQLQVNQTSIGDQRWAQVATDASGNFVVTWTSLDTNGTARHVMARRFNAQGVALGDEFLVETTNTGVQSHSVVAIDRGSGAFVIAFTSDPTGNDSNIQFRRFTADGTALDVNERQANTINRGRQQQATIVALPAGEFAIAWVTSGQLYLQRFDGSGATLGTELTVRGSEHTSSSPVLAANSAGSYLIAWQDQTASGASILAQVYGVDGSLQVGTVVLASGQVSHPAISLTDDGTILAIWQQEQAVTGPDIMMAKFDATGQRLTADQMINANTSDSQFLPSLAALDDSQFIVTWASASPVGGGSVLSRAFGDAIGKNQLPQAIVSSSLSMTEGGNLNLDASGSFDLDGWLVSYQWDLNQDGIYDVSGANVQLTWAQLQSYGIQSSAAEPYIITLQVIDNQGWSSVITTSLTVNDLAPIITVNGSGNAIRQNDYTITFTASDPGVESVSGWTVFWGDGTQSSVSAGSTSAVHRFSSPGNYQVTVQLQDSNGLHSSAAHAVTISNGNSAPTAVDDSFTVNQGGSINGATITQWFDDAWTYRQTLQVPLASPAATLPNQAVMIRLHASASDAVQINYAQVDSEGDDLRFVDMSGNLLAYEIESWNPNGYSVVWVKIPQLQSSGNGDRFYMYYGNSGASAGESSDAVWSSQYVGVYHLNQSLQDSTQQELDGNGSSLTNSGGRISGGQLFNGSNSKLDLGSSSTVDNLFDNGGTVSAWIYLMGWGENGFGRIFDKSDATNGDGGFGLQVAQTSGTDGQLLFEQGFSGTNGRWRTAAGSLSLFQWHHVVLSYDNSSVSNVPTIFIDGVAQTVTVSATPTGSRDSDATSSMTVGNRDDATDRTFFGVIDEVRLSQSMSSAQSVLQEYQNVSSARVVSLGAVQRQLSVRDNDTDPEQQSLTVSLVSGPAHASSFTLTSAGTFSYQHAGGFATEDRFVYRVDDGNGGTATATATIQINAINTAPSMSAIANQSIAEDQSTGSIQFTVSDAEQTANDLTITAQSSNPNLVDVSGITFGGSGANRTLSIMPVANAHGTTQITLTLSDGVTTTSQTFQLQVASLNDNPAITPILNQTHHEDFASQRVAFAIADVESPVSSLTVVASSSNQALIADNQLVIVGSGSQRWLQYSPQANASGSTTITLTVSDGLATSTSSFLVTVAPINDLPIIAPITPQAHSSNQPTQSLTINLSDADSSLASLSLVADSSNPLLVANQDLVITGTGASRTLQWTTQSAMAGSTVITLTTIDGPYFANFSFNLTTQGNTSPGISLPSTLSLLEDQTPNAVSVTLSDSDNDVNSLLVTLQSSNQSLVADQTLTLTGSGTSRSLQWSPIADAHGVTEITVTISDGIAVTSSTLTVTVAAVNDAPSGTDDSLSLSGLQSSLIQVSDLLINDTDIDGDTLTLILQDSPARGRLEIHNGNLRYTPTEPGATRDSFTYQVSDGTTSSGPVTVELSFEGTSLAGFSGATAANPTNSPSTVAPSSSATQSAAASETVENSKTNESSSTAASKEASSDSTSSTHSDLASQVTMAMLAQATDASSEASGTQGLELIAVLQSVDESQQVAAGRSGSDLMESTSQRSWERTGMVTLDTQEQKTAGWQLEYSVTHAPHQAAFAQPMFWEKITQMRQEVESSLMVQSGLSVGTAASTTAGMTVGYVAWVMRSGLLFSSMMTQLPIWRFMDPLAILDSTDTAEEGDQESINSMVDGELETDEPGELDRVTSEPGESS